MKAFKKTIGFLNRLKKFDLWGDKAEDVSDKEEIEMDTIPAQNPYGLIGMVLGGVGFTLGPQYGYIPFIALIFCVVTLFTFDKETEDNPWPFYLGIVMALTGLAMFISGATHILN